MAYFHAGQDFLLRTGRVIGIFDLETAGASRRTQAFFRAAQQGGAVVDLCAGAAEPRSCIVTDHAGLTVYLSPFSPAALLRRFFHGVPGKEVERGGPSFLQKGSEGKFSRRSQ